MVCVIGHLPTPRIHLTAPTLLSKLLPACETILRHCISDNLALVPFLKVRPSPGPSFMDILERALWSRARAGLTQAELCSIGLGTLRQPVWLAVF